MNKDVQEGKCVRREEDRFYWINRMMRLRSDRLEEKPSSSLRKISNKFESSSESVSFSEGWLTLNILYPPNLILQASVRKKKQWLRLPPQVSTLIELSGAVWVSRQLLFLPTHWTGLKLLTKLLKKSITKN
jgi:hypothetical protein